MPSTRERRFLKMTVAMNLGLVLVTYVAPLPLSAAQSTPKAIAASDIDGTWMGTLNAGLIKLRVVLHITHAQDGLTATIDSPDQGVSGIPATSISRDGNSLTVGTTSTANAFVGNINADQDAIDGKWTLAGKSWPLVLKRVTEEATTEPHRPQNPVKPYPYREEDVTYANKAQGDTLAATLTVPPGKGPFPAVLLIAGSGPHDRDESLLGHKPFLVLADYLTRKGIVVLRADKRGLGKSTGDYASATTADFATDAEAGVAYLKTRSEVDPHRIGLIGHSEGGIIAPMVAAQDHTIAFIVMMAGSGLPGAQVIVDQMLLISEAGGVPREQAEKSAERERELLSLVVNEKDEAVLQKELRENLAGQTPDPQIDAQIKSLTSPWYRYFLAYDPAVALRRVKCPVLAIDGSKDLQVPPEENLSAIRKALEDGGNRHVEVDELPGLNHLFQTAKTGSPSEYAGIEETISPVALEKIASWVLKQ